MTGKTSFGTCLPKNDKKQSLAILEEVQEDEDLADKVDSEAVEVVIKVEDQGTKEGTPVTPVDTKEDTILLLNAHAMQPLHTKPTHRLMVVAIKVGAIIKAVVVQATDALLLSLVEEDEDAEELLPDVDVPDEW